MSVRFKHLATVGAAIGLLLSSQQVTAQNCNFCPSPCGTWEIGAHALYFTPITCPYAYANAFTSVGQPPAVNVRNGRTQIVPCRADWGFRIFGNYLHDCFFAGLSYQWFEVTTTRSITTADNVVINGGSLGLPGRATGQVGIEYQNVDVRVGKYLLRRCGYNLYLYGNARWVDLSHRRTTQAIFTNGSIDDLREKSQLEGGALGLGFGGEFDVWCDVGAFIDGNVLGVIGNRSIKDVRHRSLIGANFAQEQESYPSETCVIPEIDFRIGVNYTYACGCWKLVGEIGYEVDYFWHASVLPDLTSNQLLLGRREFVPVCEDLGFSGLFFGGRLIF